ncbi:MAG: phosphate acetyltransferase, partial [Muribaculaceae bacterium]|nr:phosphate acetyltransferase [Muribaculaceae bacterium]
MELFDKMTQRAKANVQRIVLPEGTEPRTLTAADRIIADGIAKIILIGDPVEIMRLAGELKLSHIAEATIVNPADETVIDRYAPLFFELRKKKGITMEEARLTTANPLYLGCLMVKAGDADGQVAGAMNKTGNVLIAALQVLKTQTGISVVAGAFIMLLPKGLNNGT